MIIRLTKLRDGEDNISAQTFNYYLQSMKQFCRWMDLDHRAYKNPLEHLRKLNTRTDRRHDWRALELDELRRLLQVTKSSRKRFGLTGPERATIYQFAVETGLRAGEIRSLKVSSFDFNECIVSVEAAYSKRRRVDVLPLKPESTFQLKNSMRGKLPDVPVFKMPDKPVKMLRADLEDAGIPYVDSSGLFADFHSLRHITRNCPRAGFSTANSTTACSTAGSTRFFSTGFLRLISWRAASPPVS